MLQPASQPGPIDCCLATIHPCFAIILSFIYSLYRPGSGGDANRASTAVAELIEACNASPAGVVGRVAGFGAAAVDNSRRSSRSGLSDRKVLLHRGNAAAHGRMAELCRIVLEAMQTKREHSGETARMAHPMPRLRPRAVAPRPPPAPPRQVPPAAPGAATRSDSSPAVSGVKGGPGFATGIEAMKHTAHVMRADSTAITGRLGPVTPEAPISRLVMEPSRAIDPDEGMVA